MRVLYSFAWGCHVGYCVHIQEHECIRWKDTEGKDLDCSLGFRYCRNRGSRGYLTRQNKCIKVERLVKDPGKVFKELSEV